MNEPLYSIGSWVIHNNKPFKVMSSEWGPYTKSYYYRLRNCNELVNEKVLISEDVYNSPLWEALR